MSAEDEKTLVEKAIAPYNAEEAQLRVTYALRAFSGRHHRVRDLFPKPPARSISSR